MQTYHTTQTNMGRAKFTSRGFLLLPWTHQHKHHSRDCSITVSSHSASSRPMLKHVPPIACRDDSHHRLSVSRRRPAGRVLPTSTSALKHPFDLNTGSHNSSAPDLSPRSRSIFTANRILRLELTNNILAQGRTISSQSTHETQRMKSRQDQQGELIQLQ